MDYTYLYGHADTLYLQVTNRCTNRCSFCVRNSQTGLGDGWLSGGPEPDLDTLIAAIDDRGGVGAFRELVWCGFGEPTFRLDLIVGAGSRLRRAGARVRLNTNGHGGLVHRRDILPDLADAVDEISVSLNAPTVGRYVELCSPTSEDLTTAAASTESFWESMLDFLARAPAHFDHVTASVVGTTLRPDEITSAKALAQRMGCEGFRVR